MAIVHVGTVVLQVEITDSRREFVEELIAQIRKQVQWSASRCVEEALEGEVTSLLGRKPYERRQPPGQEVAAALQSMRFAGWAGFSARWSLSSVPGHGVGTARDQRATYVKDNGPIPDVIVKTAKRRSAISS
jgi:hypothetical protein